MTNIDILRKAFNDKFIASNQRILEEESAKMKREIKTSSIENEDFLVCKLDNNVDLFPYFKDKDSGGIKHIKKKCDYVIFVQRKTTLYILLIELKKSNNNSAIEQLKLTEQFISFIIERINISKQNDFVIENYEIRKIAITDAGKRTTKGDGYKYDEEHYLKLVGESRYIFLNQLAK